MSNRTERREAERIARKLAYQQLRQQPPQQPSITSEPAPAAEPETNPISDAQLAANRANAQLSTGPVTAEGRAKSSKNALKHALTGNTVLLPDDVPAQYQQELEIHMEIHNPIGTEELQIVQCLLDCNWRLMRIQRIETSILYKGQIECAEKFKDRPEIERRHFINAEAYLVHEKQLRNLHIQEARIRRTLDKYAAELLTLQTKRKREELAAREVAGKSPKPANPSANGFEFSSYPNHQPTAPQSDQEQRKHAA